MAQLRQDIQKFIDQDAEVIAVGPENERDFSRWWRVNQMPFKGIPDPEHRVANLYQQEIKILKGGRMPSLAVIDKEGKIHYLDHGESMSDIPSDQDVLNILEGLNKETPQVPAPAQ